MIKLVLERTGEIPLYRQLANQLREFIRQGALPTGARLPTVRQMACEYGLTRLTVHSAYMDLQAEGLIEAIVGRGTFVAATLPIPTGLTAPTAVRVQPAPAWLSQGVMADMMRMHVETELISFAAITPAQETYPIEELSKCLRTALYEPAMRGYSSTQGEITLREQVARLLLDRGIVTSPDTIAIAAGAQQGIDLTLRAFASPDDVVLAEAPTYIGLIELAAQRGQRIVSIPVNEQGIQLDLLEEACQHYKPRLLYTTPTFHNPTGYSLCIEQRKRLLQLAQRYDFYILEDDIYGLLAYDQPALEALKAYDTDQRVIYMLSFSKMLMPSLRICALVVPDKHRNDLLAVKRCSDLLCSPLLQYALAEYLRRYHLQSHLQRIRPLYKGRRDRMIAALEDHLLDVDCTWTHPNGGLCIWVTLPKRLNEKDFYLAALAQGIGIAPGSAFFTVPPAQPHMRLSFSITQPERIEQGIVGLGKLLRSQLRQYARAR